MATTRNKAFKSSVPRLPVEGPSPFLQKLDPWFVGLAQLFKEETATGVGGRNRTGGARSVGTGKRPRTIQPAPPAVLPDWPRTVGEMLIVLTNAGDPRLSEAIKAMQQGISEEALKTDLDEVLQNIISLLRY